MFWVGEAPPSARRVTLHFDRVRRRMFGPPRPAALLSPFTFGIAVWCVFLVLPGLLECARAAYVSLPASLCLPHCACASEQQLLLTTTTFAQQAYHGGMPGRAPAPHTDMFLFVLPVSDDVTRALGEYRNGTATAALRMVCLPVQLIRVCDRRSGLI